MCEGWPGGSLDDFRQHVEREYLGAKRPDQDVKVDSGAGLHRE
jgi:hypothetical protein